MKPMTPSEREEIPPPEVRRAWKLCPGKLELRIWGGRHPGVLAVGEVELRAEGPLLWRTVMWHKVEGHAPNLEAAKMMVEDATKALWENPA